MNERISSLQNPKIKHIVKLQKATERKNCREFLIEGIRELELAQQADYEFIQFFFNPEIIHRNKRYDIVEKMNHLCPVYELSSEAFSKVAYRESTEGIIALGKQKPTDLPSLKLSGCPLLLVVESVEKPGNLGAILRTADAAHLDAVIVCDPLTDLYNPNLIRSSLGCLFTVPVVSCSSSEALQYLKKNQITIYATTLQCSEAYHLHDYRGGSAFVMGTEASGLSKFWRENANEEINIPMNGIIDSLNVATATAIVVFEALRQRQFIISRAD
jgi:TrmH family RNA methyltransferase